jgi:hypothetical protein
MVSAVAVADCAFSAKVLDERINTAVAAKDRTNH